MQLAVPTLNAVSACSEESQAHSQASLFGSDAQSSMELFSQSANSSQSGQSMNSGQFGQHRAYQLQRTAHQDVTAVERNSQSQGSLSSSQKYYMKYLKASNLAGSRREPLTTPLCSDKQLGGSGESKEAFEGWKCKQSDMLRDKRIMDGVISVVKDVTNQMNVTMENLKCDIRRSSEASSSTPAEQCKVDQLAALQATTITQLLQGQEDIKKQLLKLDALVSQQSEQTATLSGRISSLEDKLSDMLPQISEQVQIKVSSVVKDIVDARLSTLIAKLDGFEEKYPRTVPQQQRPIGQENSNRFDQSVPSESGYFSIKDHPVFTEPDELKSEEVTSTAKPAALSQSTGTSCDVDLTQCSPSQCGEILSQCVQKKTTASIQVANELNTTALQATSCRVRNSTKKKYATPRKRIKLQSPLTTGVSPAVTRRRSQRRQSQPKRYKFSIAAPTVASDTDEDCSQATPSKDGTQTSTPTSLRKIKKHHRSLAPAISTILVSPSTHAVKPPTTTAATQATGGAIFESTVVAGLQREASATCSSQPTPASSATVQSSSGMKFQRSSEAGKRSMSIMSGLSNNAVREISESLRQQQMGSPESPN